jgi:hypothetical protein
LFEGFSLTRLVGVADERHRELLRGLLVVGGTLISVVAKDDVPLEKLIEVTNSIQLPPALQRESN